MGETSRTTLVQLWRQCKHCGPIITLISWGLRTHPRQFSGEFHTHGCRWQTEFDRNPDDQRRSPVWNQSHLSIVSICVIHHRVTIRIHEVKVTQGCERPYQLAKDGACVSGWTTRAKSLCKTPRVHNIALFSKTKTRNILKFKSVFLLPPSVSILNFHLLGSHLAVCICGYFLC